MKIAAEYGKVFPDNLRGKLLGRQEFDVATMIIDTLQINLTPRELLDKISAMESEELTKVQLMPGKNISNRNIFKRIHSSYMDTGKHIWWWGRGLKMLTVSSSFICAKIINY